MKPDFWERMYPQPLKVPTSPEPEENYGHRGRPRRDDHNCYVTYTNNGTAKIDRRYKLLAMREANLAKEALTLDSWRFHDVLYIGDEFRRRRDLLPLTNKFMRRVYFEIVDGMNSLNGSELPLLKTYNRTCDDEDSIGCLEDELREAQRANPNSLRYVVGLCILFDTPGRLRRERMVTNLVYLASKDRRIATYLQRKMDKPRYH